MNRRVRTLLAAAYGELASAVTEILSGRAADHSADHSAVARIRVAGLDVDVENPAGTYRRPEWPPMVAHYGELAGTEGADGEPVDAFVRAGTAPEWDGDAFVIDQPTGAGGFDEHKVMLGYATEADAVAEYLAHFPPGWACGAATRMPPGMLAAWLARGARNRPVSTGALDDGEHHPFRGNQYTGGIGGPQEGPEGPKPTSAPEGSLRHKVHALLSSGHPFSRAELVALTGGKESAIGDLLATLKNPKYSKIPLRIVRLPDGTFQVVLPSGNPAPPLPQAPPALPTPQTPAPVPAAPTPAVQVPAPPTEHTTGARQPWTRQTRPRAAAELAVRLDYVDKADFGKLSMDVVNDHMRSLSDHLLEFPELRHTQNFAGSMQSYLRNANEEAAARVTRLLVSAHPELALPENSERLRRNLKYHAKKEKAPARAWAFSARGRGGSGVSFNEKYGAPAALAKLRPSLAHNVETKWHPEGCDTIKAVADHEYGHQLDTLLGLSGNAEVGNLYKEAAGTNLPGYDWRQSAANIGGSVSRYAATNMQEFVAEAWSEVRNNPNPRPIAARLGAIVRSEYAKKFGRPA